MQQESLGSVKAANVSLRAAGHLASPWKALPAKEASRTATTATPLRMRFANRVMFLINLAGTLRPTVPLQTWYNDARQTPCTEN